MRIAKKLSRTSWVEILMLSKIRSIKVRMRKSSTELAATAKNLDAKRITASASKEVFTAMKNANAKTVKTWILTKAKTTIIMIMAMTIVDTKKNRKRKSRTWHLLQTSLCQRMVAKKRGLK